MSRQYDAIIVGGGVIGSSIAYRLASDGLSVGVIARDPVGSHASGYALGSVSYTHLTLPTIYSV